MASTTWRQWRNRSTKAAKVARKRPHRQPRCRLHLEVLEDRQLLSVSLTGVPNWKEQGPGPILNDGNTHALPDSRAVGAVESVAVEPINGPGGGSGYIAYAGTVNGGVWRSDNINAADPKTINWRPLTDQQPSLATSSMALDPLDLTGNTLWVGTGSQSSAGQAGGPAIGLLRTADGGNTWTVLGRNLAGNPIVSVVPTVDRDAVTGQQVVLAAAYGGGSLTRSADGGNTFGPVFNLNTQSFFAGRATDVVADPLNSDRFYAALPGQGVYRSDDGGLNWSSIDNGIQAMTTAALTKLAVHNSGNATVLYVAVENSNSNLTGVFRSVISSSGQASWQTIGGSNPLPGYQAFSIWFDMTADPSNANVVYIGSLDRGDASANGGQGSWTPLSNGTNAPHADTRHLVFLDSTTLIESDDGGLYRLTNPLAFPNSGQWTALNGDLRVTEFYTVAFDSIAGTVLGGAQDNGNSLQSGSGNQQWNQVGGGDGGYVAVDNSGATAKHYWMNDGPGNFFRDGAQVTLASSPGGAVASGLDAADQTLLNDFSPFPFILNSADPGRMLLYNNGVYESRTQDANHNTLLAGDVIDDITSLIPAHTGYFQAGAYGNLDDADVIYVGTSGGQLFERRFAGAAFTQLSDYPGGAPQRIVIDRNIPQIVDVLDTSGRIWRQSIDNTWHELTFNLPSLTGQVVSIELYDPASAGQTGAPVLLAAGLGGVFRQLGTGSNSWSLYGQGLPNVLVTDLHYMPPNGDQATGDLLLAGTLGRGAWLVPNASGTLAVSGTLTVTDDSSLNNLVVIQGVPNSPNFLEVLENGNVEYAGRASLFSSITINEGSAADNVDIEQDLGVPINVNMGSGHDAVNISALGDNFGGILASVIINRGSGSDSLNINDGLDTEPVTWTLSGSTIYNSNVLAGVVDYNGMDFVGLRTGGNTTIEVAPQGQNLDAIQGALTIIGNGTDALIVNDQNNPNFVVPTQYTITRTTLTRNSVDLLGRPRNASIAFSNLGSLELDTGALLNVVNVESTAAATMVNAGAGTLLVEVSPNAENLDNLPGALFINGNGSDPVIVNDQNNPNFVVPTQYAITSTTLTRNSVDLLGRPRNASIFFSNVGSLELDTGARINVVTVVSAPASLRISGGVGINTLVGPNTSNTWSLTGPGAGTVGNVAFSHMGILRGGAAADTFQFGPMGSVPVLIDGGGGRNTLDYSTDGGVGAIVNLQTGAASRINGGAAGGFKGIQHLLGSSGGGDMAVGPDAKSTWLITGANAGSVGGFTFAGVENLRGGSQNDVFRFGPAGSLQGLVDGGGGSNTLDYSTDGGVAATVNLQTHAASRLHGGVSGGFVHIQAVVGSTAISDRLIGLNGPTLWQIAGNNAGLAGTVAFAGIENLQGGTASDTFRISPIAVLSGTIAGGGGGDWLDYSLFSTPVTVNLATGVATHVAGGATGKVSQIQNVTGGSGNDTLVGNAQGNILIGGGGNDNIIGGSGRSVLIGGAGGDVIKGGSADDILIGGTTNFDSNHATLMAILSEWQRTDKTYPQRIADLKNGGGLNGTNKLIWGTTVHDDAAADTLTGGAGLDWFFANLGPGGVVDHITDLNNGGAEQVD